MRSTWRTLDRGLRADIALVCLADGIVGVSYGAIAVGLGFAPWLPVLMAGLVLAGASEFLFVGIVAAGGSPLAALAAGLLVNARHLPFGLAVGDVTGGGWRRMLGSHVLNDESAVFALGQDDAVRRRAAYWLCGIGILVCWPAGALIGATAGSVIGDTDVLGLDAMFPTVLLALVIPALRDLATARAALVGAGVALAATPFLPAGIPVLLALVGLCAGGVRKVAVR
ncbi:4-azaleucine resistance transporter AzlC [Rhodococcus sp. PvR044]|uniref:AzlC family ABC transporter permease n=1 Tax=Rhodococcus TaxID=1827 RepID=UPI000BE2FD75|nr:MULTISPECIES: AzlC family ABC transporter permease [Rhodococcus]MBP1161716.1 4-azaleucine resistance transporter AzlC [Rhodococcus sp. PvR099]MCZ4555654.1 AzlC family ABC transporter permease [Rhodococcus maanshanensis]